MNRILVTGGAGFIGSNITKRLLTLGCEVVVLDNFSTGHLSNLPQSDKLVIIRGCVSKYSDVLRALDRKPNIICHQAALPSVPRSIKEPILSNEHNIQGTLNILEGARERKIKRVVYAASSSFYGDAPATLKHEGLPFNPLSPYALQKGVGEIYCHLYHSLYGLETMCLKYFNVFGPSQDPQSNYAAVIPLFITKILKGERPTINGDGGHSRDFTYIDNVVEGNIKALLSPSSEYGITVNCATGGNVTLTRLVEEINSILGTSVEAIYGPPRAGDIKHSQANIEKAKEVLGYESTVSFREGLERTIEWYKKKI